MALRLRRRLVVPVMLGTSLLLAPFAHADEGVDKATWDSGYATGSCTTGTNTRTCTYDVDYTNCEEASASTGGPQVVIPCDVHFHGTVTVQPRLNAAGRVVGCTSVVGTDSGYVDFNSNVWDDFDRTITPITITVQSAHPDQSAAVVHFTGTTIGVSQTGTSYAWTVNGTMTATCAPAKTSASNVTAGTVDVAVRTQVQ